MKVNNTKIFSILLAISWFIVLFFLLYPFIRYNTPPNFWLLLILAILPLFMLVQKLKIGSFLDFSKSDSPPPHTTTTIWQQINLPIVGHDLASAIAESISKALQHQKEDMTSPSQKNKPSKYNTLNYSVDILLIAAIPTIISYYSFVTNMVQHKPPSIPDDFTEPFSIVATMAFLPEKAINYTSVSRFITIIQANIKSVFSTFADELSLDFTNIQKLIELRTSTATKTQELKLSKENIDILFKAVESEGRLTGFISGNWVGLRSSMKLLLSANKPTNNSPNK